MMQLMLITSMAILAYMSATVVIGRNMVGDGAAGKYRLSYGFAITALVLHGFLLYHWIDGGVSSYLASPGQNLHYFNLISMIYWLAAVLVVLISLCKPVQSLLLVNLPLAAISIIIVTAFPGYHLVHTGANLHSLFHVLASITVFSLFCVAASQAVLLAVQDRFLRLKRNVMLLQFLPPIETMEKVLFQVLILGFVLLSIVVVTSMILFANGWDSDMAHGTIVSIVAWLTFALLLWGHYHLGWRGKTVIRLTLTGSGLLALSYFGRWLILG